MGVSVIIAHSDHLSQVSLSVSSHTKQAICYYMLQLVYWVILKYLFILYKSIRSNVYAGMPFTCTKCDTEIINIPREKFQDITIPYITLYCYLYGVCQMMNYFMYIGVKQYRPYNSNVLLCDHKTHGLWFFKCHMPIHTERHDRRGNEACALVKHARPNAMPFTCTKCDFDIVDNISEILNDFMAMKCTRWDEWSIVIFSNDV